MYTQFAVQLEKGDLVLMYTDSLIESMSTNGSCLGERGLLDLFDEVANDPALRLDMELEVGDVQLISNHTIVHARTRYEDGLDATHKRHLLRLWLSLDRV